MLQKFWILFILVLGSFPCITMAQTPHKNTPQNVRITCAAVGDIVFGRAGDKFGLDDPFRHVAHLWKGRDIVYGNLETPISQKQYRNIRKPKNCQQMACTDEEKGYRRIHRLTFFGRPESATLLKNAGFTVMGTANNHAEDQGPQGLLETIEYLQKAGLSYCGTGASKEDAWKPYVFEKQGVKVALLAITALWNFPPMRKGAFYALSEFPKILTELPPRVKALKEKYDFVIVALHYGEEYVHYPENRERKLMVLLADAGVDVVIGGHPHVLRGIQVIRKTVVFYSMGNFLFDSNKNAQIESGVALFDLVRDAKGKRIENITFHPVRNDGNPGYILPRHITGNTAITQLKKILQYSRALNNHPSELTIEENALIVRPQAFVESQP